MGNSTIKIKVIDNSINMLAKLQEYPDKSVVYTLNNNICIEILKNTLDVENLEYTIEILKQQSDYLSVDPLKIIKSNVRQRKNCQKTTIGVGKDVEYLILAYYQSILTDSDFFIVEKLEEALAYVRDNAYKFYTFILPYEEIDMFTVHELQMLQNEMERNSYTPFFYGFMSARTIFILNALIIKNYILRDLSREKYVVINRVDYAETDIQNNLDVFNLNYHIALTENIEKLACKLPINALTLVGHGRDDILWLTNGSICGASKYDNMQMKKSKQLPICVYRNRCLMSNGKAINIYGLKARNMFSNACKSLKLEESVFGNNYNLAYSFIEGYGLSYIGCNSTVLGTDVANYYYVAQLRAGIQLGIIAYQLTKMCQDKGLEITESYQLLGDPTYKNIDIHNVIIYQISSLISDGMENVFVYNVKEDAEMISVELPIENFDIKFYSLEWVLYGYLEKQRLFGAFRRDGKLTVLDLFSIGPIRAGEKLVLKFAYNNRFKSEYIFKFASIIDFGLTDNRLKLPIIEAKEVAQRLFGTYKFTINELDNNYKKLYSKLDKLYNRLPKLSRLVVEYLVEKTHNEGFSWEEATLKYGMKYEEYLANCNNICCDNCGRKTYGITMSHSFNKSIKRVVFNCPICGIVRDVPIDSEEMIYLTGENVVDMEAVNKQQILIENKSEKQIIGCVGIAITSGKRNFVIYEKNVIDIEIKPYETVKENLKLKFFKEAKPHQYWLYCYLILNGDIYVLKKDIWLRDTENWEAKGNET